MELTPLTYKELVEKTFEFRDKQNEVIHKTLDWGAFVGELNGFSIIEADEVEIGILLQRYSPFVHFKVYAIVGVEGVEKVIEGMQK